MKKLKVELNKQTKEELIKEILKLYKKFKPVKEYLDFFLNPDEESLLDIYKDKVREGFFPKRGWNLKLSISRKAINDFKKIGVSKKSIADLMLYFVECGIEFTNEYGDIDEQFYSSIENTYSNALKIMNEEGVLKQFKIRASAVVDDTSNIGWGFHDFLAGEYDEHFNRRK